MNRLCDPAQDVFQHVRCAWQSRRVAWSAQGLRLIDAVYRPLFAPFLATVESREVLINMLAWKLIIKSRKTIKKKKKIGDCLLVMRRTNSLEEDFSLFRIDGWVDPLGPCRQALAKSLHSIHVFEYFSTILNIIPSTVEQKSQEIIWHVLYLTMCFHRNT